MIQEFLKLYLEAGMIGVVGAMFVFMVYQNAKRAESQAEDIDALRVHNEGQSKQIEAIYTMVIKFLDRWNKSDDVSLRHREDIMRETSDLAEKISYLSGRINSKS